MKDYQCDLLQEFREEYEKTQDSVSDESLINIALIVAKDHFRKLNKNLDEIKNNPLAD